MEASLCPYCNTPVPPGSTYCCEACRLLSTKDWIKSSSERELPSAFVPYQNEELRQRYEHSPRDDYRQYRIYIEGLQCSSCVHLLESLPVYLPKVLKAELRFSEAELRVRTDTSLGLGELLAFIESMGYKPLPLEPSEDATLAREKEDRDLLRRIAVAGACSGNIMLFTVPIYAGLAGDLKVLFSILSFLIFLPVLVYSAAPIYRSAWSGLRLGKLNVDFALSLAFLSGFGASTFNFVRQSDAVYFDSSAGFLFLILVSRWFLKKSQRRWIQSPLTQLPWLKSQLLLKPGDNFDLKELECVPADAELLSDRAAFDPSWITGEALPLILPKGALVPAGYRLVTQDASLKAKSGVSDSSLAKSLKRIEQESLRESRRMDIFDKASQILLLVVFALAALMLGLGPMVLGISLHAAFERALSLLIVACPCALAFGGPLAYAMSLKKAAASGVLVKSADVLDQLDECKQLVFDKTGTLTLGSLRLVQKPENLSPWMMDLVLGLEGDSKHPVAFAFRRAFADHKQRPLHISDIHEIPGEKVFGIFEGHVYSLQKAVGPGLSVELKRNQDVLARFDFDDSLRSESAELLRRFSKSHKLMILSGDRSERVQDLVHKLQVPGLIGFGDQKPEDKAAKVRELNPCVMIGDGVNDNEALASARVGVAVSGSLEMGLRSASVYLMQPGLRPLMCLFILARKTRHLVRRNLSFALAYNIGAGAAALSGFVGPLAAALLMPLSSILILISTWEASR